MNFDTSQIIINQSKYKLSPYSCITIFTKLRILKLNTKISSTHQRVSPCATHHDHRGKTLMDTCKQALRRRKRPRRSYLYPAWLSGCILYAIDDRKGNRWQDGQSRTRHVKFFFKSSCLCNFSTRKDEVTIIESVWKCCWSWSGRSARPRPTALLPPRSNGKPEAATAAVELLMMDMRMPETCWAAFKRQAINLRNCCI